MNKPSNRVRKLLATSLTVMTLAAGVALTTTSAANAAGAIPCVRNAEGVCHGYGSSGGGDPWVANLFHEVSAGDLTVFARNNGADVDQYYATALAKNLHYRYCVVQPGRPKIAVCA